MRDSKSVEQERILKFLLVVAYVKEKEELILPYMKGIHQLLKADTLEEIRSTISYLVNKTNQLNQKHDERLNSVLPKLIKALSTLFLETTGYLGVGIYGSFANHTSNQYSDLDIMVFVPIGFDQLEAKKTTIEFFCPFIPIPMDVKVTSQEEMESELTIGMKRTLKILKGDIKWKKSMN